MIWLLAHCDHVFGGPEPIEVRSDGYGVVGCLDNILGLWLGMQYLLGRGSRFSGRVRLRCHRDEETEMFDTFSFVKNVMRDEDIAIVLDVTGRASSVPTIENVYGEGVREAVESALTHALVPYKVFPEFREDDEMTEVRRGGKRGFSLCLPVGEEVHSREAVFYLGDYGISRLETMVDVLVRAFL